MRIDSSQGLHDSRAGLGTRRVSLFSSARILVSYHDKSLQSMMALTSEGIMSVFIPPEPLEMYDGHFRLARRPRLAIHKATRHEPCETERTVGSSGRELRVKKCLNARDSGRPISGPSLQPEGSLTPGTICISCGAVDYQGAGTQTPHSFNAQDSHLEQTAMTPTMLMGPGLIG